MKKLSDLKIGILIGLVAASAVIAYKPVTEYYAMAGLTDSVRNLSLDVTDTFNEIAGTVLGGTNQRLDYDDVFGSASYHNLYLLMFQTAFVEPEENAVKTVAAAYGFTLAEAKAVQQGSLQPILAKFSGGSEKTQQDIYDLAAQFQEDFNEVYDMAALEQELNIGASASEIFSNGEVTDSGFDLVHDLDVIEQVIFGSKTKGTLGGPIEFGGSDDEEKLAEKLIAQGNTDSEPEAPDVYNELDKTENIDGGQALEEGDVADGGTTPPQTFDPTTLVEVTENDLCPKPETALEGALNDFQEKNPANVGTEDPAADAQAEAAATTAAKEPSVKAENVAAKNSNTLVDKVVPEAADDWSDKASCNGFLYPDPKKNQTGTAGDPTKISADFYICLESIIKWTKYGTVIPDKPCIKCETDKIAAYLNKTLEHSFVPNKVTGNFLEPSKCKSAFTNLLDIKFNLIWAPIPTARKDESMELKSLRKEWDKFTSRSQPLGFQDIPMTWLGDNQKETAADTALQNVADGASYSQLMEQVDVITATFAKEAAEGSELFGTISEGENFVTYSQDVMKEVDQMTRYFLNFRDIFDKLATETCPNILRKPKIK